MHVDINSCFATIEQQANPFLRGKPVAVAAYDSPRGCILAPSIEAKKYGVATGMRVIEGKKLCPALVILLPDPNKYRDVHLKLRKILAGYTNEFVAKSIDEFVLNLAGYPSVAELGMIGVARQIKQKIRKNIGDWITVSIGIAPNRFLAKVASNLKKPNGLEVIDKTNYLKVFAKLDVTDLCGIKKGYGSRLYCKGIYTARDFYNAPLWKLKSAFKSINSYYWYLRLRGFESDNVEFGRKSYGNSYALARPTVGEGANSVLAKLVEKMSYRLRSGGYCASGIHLTILFKNGRYWHKGVSFSEQLFATPQILKKTRMIFDMAPKIEIRNLAVSCFGLKSIGGLQLGLFNDLEKCFKLVLSVDAINKDFGAFTISSAQTLAAGNAVPDRIAFGGVKELEKIVF